MRPISKGNNNKKFKKYSDARPDLTKRLGKYCSYCEMKMPTSIHIEHVLPKSLHNELRLEWDNFLLACPHCNSKKGSKDIQLKDYLWPDKDNTFLAFEYSEAGRIVVNDELQKGQKRCAQKTLDLVGLQNRPGTKDFKKTDLRWDDYQEAWNLAIISLEALKEKDTILQRKQIVEYAHSNGHFSLWMTVFKNDSDMLKRFIKKFPGTCKKCFDKEGVPVPRKGGIV